MRLRHPYTLDADAPEPDGIVHYGGRREWSVVDDGTFTIPDERAASFVANWPTADGYTLSDLRVADDAATTADTDTDTDTDVVAADGGTCGYYDPDEMDAPCGRPAGWGTEYDTGRCRDHIDR